MISAIEVSENQLLKNVCKPRGASGSKNLFKIKKNATTEVKPMAHLRFPEAAACAGAVFTEAVFAEAVFVMSDLLLCCLAQ